MIRNEKLDNAFYALDGLLFRTRAMAFSPEEKTALADVLDFAEYLPSLMASPGDTTDEFRAFLETLSEMNPAFAFVLDRFDADEPPARWWE